MTTTIAAYSVERAGWCVFIEHGMTAELKAGPFMTREEAESVLGPPLIDEPQPRKLSYERGATANVLGHFAAQDGT